LNDDENFRQIDFSPHCPITVRQQNAALWLVRGLGVVQVARKVGVSPQQVCNWKLKPEFRAWYERLRDAVMEEALDVLVAHQFAAADTLTKLLKSKDERVRLRAAVNVIHLAQERLEARRADGPLPGVIPDGFTLEEKAG